jgi:hypothetical protein
MTPTDQKSLFKELMERHAGWTARFVSGFVHGASDAGEFNHPKRDFIVTARAGDDYGLGYLLGFAVYYGSDCVTERWFSLIAPLVPKK